MSFEVIHTIAPGMAMPYNYFSDKNIEFIQNKISEVLSRDFRQHILIDKASIIRTMQYILSERREAIPKMNQRVIMYICDDYKNYQNEVNRNLRWEDNFVTSQRLVDTQGGNLKFDNRSIKTTDQKKYNGQTKVGGSLRFYFT